MKTTLKATFAIALAAATFIGTADASFARTKASYCRSYARNVARHAGGQNVAAGLALALAGVP